ncbi:hypothetical protein LLZ88_02300 [Ureaplasma urealyticum]|uniref:DUF3713 domain-containing protein n=1 Tax=Ureaplasma urealyticum TaxID=2130 RepID=UPI001F1C6F40|nr:DUF3713 domain-containing protein [Ureaplasma urealyticum]UIU14899.1 hypothetical protein LLZ88_02300 [Ureaplasma urealyticum]
MKLKKVLLTSALSILGVASITSLVAACSQTKTKVNQYKVVINKLDSLNLTSNLSTKQALKNALFSMEGQNEFLLSNVKKVVYDWAKNNNDPKLARAVSEYDTQLDDQLKRIKKNVKKSYPNDWETVLQSELYDSEGGSEKLWKQAKAIDEAYKTITSTMFDDNNDWISVLNEQNQLVDAYSNDATKLLENENVFKATNIGERNKIVAKTNNPWQKGYANLFDFLIDDYIKYNLPLSFANLEFKYDDLKNQNIYNKEFFKKVPSSGTSFDFPWFDPKPADNKSTNTTTNYLEVVKLLKENKYLDQKDNTNNIDKKFNNNNDINKNLNLNDFITQDSTNSVLAIGLLAKFLSLFGNQNFGIHQSDNLDETSILNNFINKNQSTSNSDSVNLFYPLAKKDKTAFLNDFKGVKAIRQINDLKNEYTLLRNEKSVDLWGINNFKRLQQATQLGLNALLTELKNDFLYNGALYLNSRKSSSVKKQGFDIKAKIKDYFNTNKERLLASYIATHQNDSDFLFKSNLKSHAKVFSFDQKTTDIIKQYNEIHLLNHYDNLVHKLNDKLIKFNKKTFITPNVDNLYDNGINTPIYLNKDQNQQISLFQTLKTKLVGNKNLVDENKKLSTMINNYVESFDVQKHLVANNQKSQSIVFDDYIINKVFTKGINSVFANVIKQKQIKKSVANFFEFADFSFKNNLVENQEILAAFNQIIKNSSVLETEQTNSFSSFDDLKKVYEQALKLWNENYTKNGPYNQLSINYQKYQALFETLAVISYLLDFKNNKPTYQNLINYLLKRTANHQPLFIGWKALNDTTKITDFGKDSKKDFSFKKYQANLYNGLDLYQLKKEDVYELDQTSQEVKFKKTFLDALTYTDDKVYWNSTINKDGSIYNNFIGLIDQNNQKNKLGKAFEKINLFDKLVYANNPSTQFKGSLYGYGSKENLIKILDKFTSYHDYQALAQLLYNLNFNSEANAEFKTILDNKKQVIPGDQKDNKVKNIDLATNEIKAIMIKGINKIPQTAFERLDLDLVYNKLDKNATPLVNKENNSNLKYVLLVSQFNANDVQNLVINNELNQSATGYLGLSKNQFYNLLFDLALNDQTLKVEAFSQIENEHKIKVYDKRLANNSNLKGWIINNL